MVFFILLFSLIFPFYSFGNIIISEELKSQHPEIVKTLDLKNSNPANINSILKKFYKTYTYDNVYAQKKENGIFITAKLNRMIHSFEITGNTIYSRKEIQNTLEIKDGDSFHPSVLHENIKVMKKKYNDHGYFKTRIHLGFKRFTDNKYDLNINIEENAPCIIKHINITTANNKLKKSLTRRLKYLIGDYLSVNNIDNIQTTVRDYLKDYRFLKAGIEASKIEYNEDKTEATLYINIERAENFQFYISGNKHHSLPSLYRYLNIDENTDIYAINPTSTITTKITERYKKSGFPHIEINTQSKKTDFTKKLYIQIKEGQRVKIKELNINGSFSKNPSYYSDFIMEHSSPLVSAGYYNKNDIENGLKNLISHLRNIGFIQARNLSINSKFSPKKDSISINVFIDEGPATLINKVIFEGIQEITRLELLKVIHLKPNQPLILDKVEESLKLIENYYKQRGFLEVNILNNVDDLVKYETNEAKADIHYKIYEGPKIIIDRIITKGNKQTKRRVIIDEVELELGTTLTQEKVTETKVRLNELGLFTRTGVDTLEKGTPKEDRAVVLSVTERNPGLMRFGIGANSEDEFTLRGFASVSYLNLFGTARAVSVRTDLKSNQIHEEFLQRRVAFSYLEPFIFNRRIRGRLNLTHDYSLYDIDTFALQESNKVELFLEKPFSRKVKLSWNLWSLDATRSFQDKIVGTTPDFEPSQIQISSIGPTLYLDYRDNSFIPTKGIYSRTSAEYSSPLLGSSDKIEFFKAESVFSFYFNLIPKTKVILANSIRGGYLKNLSSKSGSGVPASRAFILGGHSTIRGFGGTGVYERVPNGIELDSLSSPNKLIIDNQSTYYLFKTELRFPIPRMEKYGLGGVIFYDGGSVSVKGKTFKKPYRQSFGVGLRVNTPVGPVVVDYARKIDRSDDEEEGRIHFTIGSF